MNSSLDTTNMWLAVLAIAAAIQTLMLLAGAIAVFLALRTVRSQIEQLEQRHIAPISNRVSAVVDDVRDMIARARQTEAAVRAQAQRIEHAVHVGRQVLLQRVWPVIGVGRAISAGLGVLTQRSPHSTSPLTPRDRRATTTS